MVRNSLYDSRGCPVSVVCFHFRCCTNICASSTFMCVCFLLHSTFSFTLFCFVFVIVIRQLQCLTQLHTSANIYLCVVCRARERESWASDVWFDAFESTHFCCAPCRRVCVSVSMSTWRCMFLKTILFCSVVIWWRAKVHIFVLTWFSISIEYNWHYL